MKIAVLLGESLVAALALANGVAQEIILWAAAGAGVLWFLVHVIKPGLRWMRSLFRSAEAFEQLPEWMATMEAESARVLAKLTRMENRQRAMNRDMGIQARGDERADSFDVVDGPSEQD